MSPAQFDDAPEVIIALVTAPLAEAPEIARTLVDDQLAACVNILDDVRSIYRWEGKLCDDREALLIIKSRQALAEQLIRKVTELHSYDTPEVICLPISAGHLPYLNWVVGETAG